MKVSTVGVVGLGYVGLPLAVALARRFEVRGFDISASRIAELRAGKDETHEVSADQIANSALTLSDDPRSLRGCDVFIVTVPTPVDDANRPDLKPILTACEQLGPALKPGCIVVFESTVYPGITEEVCGPALELSSSLRYGSDFKLGYSPERINPGDREHSLDKVVKVVAAQDTETLETLAELYGAVIGAGVHRASSIKVAETAKVIENTQRDLNIALMNELSMICDRLDIRTSEVLAAAGTKWNFVKFHPGLVGGHCIGVDPYYLTAKAEQIGYQPEVILAGRRINDGMGQHVAQKALKLLASTGKQIGDARIGILGLTFKQNIPDIRNSKVPDIVRELRQFGAQPIVHDPLAVPTGVREEYGIELASLDLFSNLSALLLAVPHDSYLELGSGRLAEMITPGGVLIDLYSKIDPATLRGDIRYWSL